MKGYLKLLLVLVCYIEISNCVQSQISSQLWYKTYIGDINQISYPYEEQPNIIVTSSTQGYIHLIDLSNSQIIFRKLLNEDNFITSNKKNIVTVNKNGSNIKVFNTRGGQLGLNLDNSINTNNPKIESLILNNKKNMNIFISKERFRIFTTEKSLYDSKMKDKNEYYDYYVHEEDEKIYYIFKNNNTFFINQLPTTKISQNSPSLVNQYKEENTNEIILTKNKLFFIFSNKISIYDYLSNKNEKIDVTINTNLLKDQIYISKNYNILVLKSQNSLNILKSDNKIFTVKTSFDKCIISNEKLVCFIQEQNILKYTIYDLLQPEKQKNSQIKLLSVDKIEYIAIKSTKSKLVITITTNKSIIQYHSDILKYTFDNTFSNIIFSQMIAYSSTLENEEQSKENKYFTTFELFNQKDLSNIIRNFVHIIITDIIEITNSLKNSIIDIYNTIQDKNFINNLKDFNNQSIDILTKETVTQSLFLYTNNNELYVLNGINGEIKFNKKFDNNLVLYKINKKYANEKVIEKLSELQIELLFNVKENNNTIVYEYNLIKNTLSLNDEYKNDNYSFNQAISSFEMKLVQSHNKISYINLSKQLNNENKKHLLNLNNKITIEKYGNTIYGFKYSLNSKNEMIMNIIYNLKFEDIINYSFPEISKNPNPTYLVNGKIYYKLINQNIIVVLSKNQNKNLLITIIQGENGNILDEIIIMNIDLSSITFLFEDNWGIISYIKREKGFKRNEIFTFELMKQEIEYSLTNLFEKYFKSYSSLSTIDLNDITILSKTFVLDHHVKGLYKSISQLSNANKFIIILFENNKILLIDRRSFSPRRPIMKDIKGKPTFDPSINSIYVDQELPGYQAIVNINHKFILDSNIKIDEINDIVVSPTGNESTFIICSVGVDLKCYKVYPDKIYDSFNTSYLKCLIGIFLIVSIIVVAMIRRYVKKMEFKNLFFASTS